MFEEFMVDREPPRTTVERKNGFFKSLFTGDHTSKFKTPVPDGVDGDDAAAAISRRLARDPAPDLCVLPTTHVPPNPIPQPIQTMGQPSWVSQASSADNKDHSVLVEADPNHILGGKGGASGVSYETRAKEKHGQRYVVTKKESYGKSPWWTNALRGLAGRVALDSNTVNAHDSVMDELVAPPPVLMPTPTPTTPTPTTPTPGPSGE